MYDSYISRGGLLNPTSPTEHLLKLSSILYVYVCYVCMHDIHMYICMSFKIKTMKIDKQAWVYVYMSICVYVYMSQVYVGILALIYSHILVCLYVCMQVKMHVCIHVCLYVDTDKYICSISIWICIYDIFINSHHISSPLCWLLS